MPGTSANDLDQWLSYIEAMHARDIDMGLDRIMPVALRLGVNRLPMPVMTIAGTNGKGSTVALAAALAGLQGARVATYTSPHVHVFNERIQLPDGPVSDEQLCEAFEAVEAARQQTPLTYFEFTTLAALWLFLRSDATLVVLEVGLGGRLDAVNLVDPDVSVVTSVGLDHQDWLGDTREAIAEEKCGIGRPGIPLVYGETDWPENLLQLADVWAFQAILAGRQFGIQGRHLSLASGRQLLLPETVPLGHDNLATACQALALVGIDVSQSDLSAIETLTLIGRAERLAVAEVDCWLDVGHNREAVARFMSFLPSCEGQRHVVFGMMKDKPIADTMALFEGMSVSWYLAAPRVERASPAVWLQAFCPEGQPSLCFESVEQAVERAVSLAQPNDQVLVLGSFFTVSEARTWLLQHH